MEKKSYDVVIVGAALGGLIAGALLAKRGYRVAVVEELDQAGGRSGATEYNGYWVDWGHRDGHGYGDLAWIFHHGAKAAKEVGIELDFKVWKSRGTWRLHTLPAGEVSEMSSADAQGMLSDDPIESFRRLAELLGMTDPPRIAAAAARAMEKINAIPDEEAWNLIETTMGEWLERNVEDRGARNLILQMLENACASPGENASLGRFVFNTRRGPEYLTSRSGVPDDLEVGGMQGAVLPWVRAIESMGGEMWLGWKPTEILVEGRSVRGVVAVNRSSLVQVFDAPVVITDFEAWDLPGLLSDDLLPRNFRALAENVKNHTAQIISWWVGLKRLPRRRSDQQVESHLSWQRILYGEGAVKKYYGGFHYPSAVSSKSAPPGKHLMVLTLPAHGEFRWANFHQAKTAIDISLEYLRSYYVDLDDCIEWSRYQYIPDQVMAWNLKPIKRPPTKVATIDGLYLATATAEGKAAWADREAEAALDAVHLMEEDFGAYFARRRRDGEGGSQGASGAPGHSETAQ